MLQLAYYALLLGVITWIGYGMLRAASGITKDIAGQQKIMKGYITFVVVWVTYVSVLAGIGFLADFSLPPKMVVFVVLPAFVIIGWFFTAKKFKDIIKAFPEPLTIYFQSFRIIVELLIWGAVLKGLGPELISFEGRNFDIIAGLTAPFVGYLAYNKKVLSTKVLLVWNIACLLLLANIVFIFISLVVKPEIWGYATTPISTDFPRLPYIYIAGMYMPAAVFMHIMSIRKLIARMKIPGNNS